MSIFAKRHYEAIALVMQEAIREINFAGDLDGSAQQMWNSVCDELADTFKRDNGNFDRARFKHACLPGSNVRAKTAHLKTA